MKRCYICSRILTDLNTDNFPHNDRCVNCSLNFEEYTERLKNEIESTKKHRKRKKT
jgi:hypothetical protein